MGDVINLDEQRELRKKAAAATEAPTEAPTEPQALEIFLAGAFVAAFPPPEPAEDPEC